MRRQGFAGSLSRRSALSLALAGLAGCAWPAPVFGQTAPPASDGVPPGDEQARLLENLLTRMGVEVNLGGGRKPVFVIDTGAERTAVSDRLAAEMNLSPAPSVLVHGITTAQMTQSVVLPHLDFSGRRFSDLTPPVFPHALLGADGLLGLDVLSRFRLTLDMRLRRVMIAASGPDVVERGIAFGRASRVRNDISDTRRGRFSQLLLTDVQVEGVSAIAFIDSGAQYSIANRALMQAADARSGPAQRQAVQVYGVIGQSLIVDSGSVASLRLAKREIGPAPLLFGDLHAFHVLGLADQPALLVGADILTRFSRITLDYGRARIMFGSARRRST